MRKPGRYDIHIYQGATFRLSITWLHPDGTPVDLTGASARMQGRLRHDTPTTLFSLSSPTNIVLGGTNGTIVATMSAAQTAALNFDEGVYDLEIAFPDGEVVRLLEGKVFLHPEVTK